MIVSDYIADRLLSLPNTNTSLQADFAIML